MILTFLFFFLMFLKKTSFDLFRCKNAHFLRYLRAYRGYIMITVSVFTIYKSFYKICQQKDFSPLFCPLYKAAWVFYEYLSLSCKTGRNSPQILARQEKAITIQTYHGYKMTTVTKRQLYLYLLYKRHCNKFANIDIFTHCSDLLTNLCAYFMNIYQYVVYRKDWKRICAESSIMSPRKHKRPRN